MFSGGSLGQLLRGGDTQSKKNREASKKGKKGEGSAPLDDSLWVRFAGGERPSHGGKKVIEKKRKRQATC